MRTIPDPRPPATPGRALALAVALLVALGVAACDDDGGDDDSDDGASVAAVSLVGGGWINFQDQTTTNFYGMFHGFRGVSAGEVESRVGAGGTLTEFSAAITAAPPSGSWTFTVIKNGAAQAVSCSIAGASDTCVDAAGCVELAGGDEIAVRVTPAGATANAGGPRWTAVFTAASTCS